MAETLKYTGPEIRISPEGIQTVGMTLGGEDYYLLASPSTITATRLAKQLQQGKGVLSLLGLPFDREAAQNGQLRLIRPEEVQPPVYRVGVYLPAQSFDNTFTWMESIIDPALAAHGLRP